MVIWNLRYKRKEMTEPRNLHPVLEKWSRLHRKYLRWEMEPYDFRTTELAKRLGVTTRTVERWVRGIGRPKEKHIEIIRRFLSERTPE